MNHQHLNSSGSKSKAKTQTGQIKRTRPPTQSTSSLLEKPPKPLKNKEKIRKFQRRLSNERKIDYSHVQSKIKEEVDYHRQLNRQSKKMQEEYHDNSKREYEESHDDYRKNIEDSRQNYENYQDYQEESRKNYDDIYENNPKYDPYEKNRQDTKYRANWGEDQRQTENYSYSMESESKRKSLNPNRSDYSQENNNNNSSKYEMQEDISNNNNNNNDYVYNNNNNNNEYGYESNNNQEKSRYSYENERVQLKSSKDSDYYTKNYYQRESDRKLPLGLRQKKSKEEMLSKIESKDDYMRKFDSLEESHASQENYSYFKPTNDISRYSQYSSLKQKNLGDIASDFLNSPLMGKISNEQRDRSFQIQKNRENELPLTNLTNNPNGKYRTSTQNFDKYYTNNKENPSLFNNLRKMNSLSSNPPMQQSSGFIYKKPVSDKEKDVDTHSSSMSSNFSVFNPNEELKSFFQKEFLHNNNNNRHINNNNDNSNSKIQHESSFEGEGDSGEFKSESQGISSGGSKKREKYEENGRKGKNAAYDYSYLFKKKA